MGMIVGEAIVSCYADIASLLVMGLLLVLSERIRQKKTEALQLFFIFCCQVTFTCLVCFAFDAMYRQSAPWCHAAALIFRTLEEYCELAIVGLWLALVEKKLYRSGGRKPLLRALRVAPLAVFALLLLVNLFNGVMFTIAPDNRIEAKPLYYVMIAVSYLLFLSASLMVRSYDRRATKIRFFHIMPMLVSVLLFQLPQFFTQYSTGILGIAIGVTLIYFSMIGELRFVDEESGLYNKGYVVYLLDLALVGKNDTRSALILEAEGDPAACFAVLRGTLHGEGDVIRTEKQKFVMFSNVESRATMQYYTSQADEAVSRHNAEHPENKIHISVRCLMRERDTDAVSFLRTVMEGKKSGDAMRGIVSMMTELDRLDKELKLAADIQLSILPMNFPAFPDRTEFDLYAAMDPAREVGGDFYDFFLIDSDHLALTIADVSGKGVPAALFMMISKALLRNQIMAGCGPAEALRRVNDQLCERNDADMFVTVWIGVLKISTGTLTAANAGHEFPALKRAGGEFELFKDKHGFVVGGMEGIKFKEYTLALEPGDKLFVYTDGVPEATDAENALFGTGRMLAALNENADAAPREMLQAVRRAVDGFVKDAEQFDDLTMLGFAYKGREAE
ncbi:MAG: hypothetical protein E7474_03065 [Ruminococcaceae bacterium]|nr:hypothetical protein [Oscillospiraceae bacterium]